MDKSVRGSASASVVAVACLDRLNRTVEPFGAFSSLAEFMQALEAECRGGGHPLPCPIAVDRDGYGAVRVADTSGKVVAEYVLIANDGSRYGEAGGVAGFALACDHDGSVYDVYPCGIYASEAEIRDLDAFERRVIKGIEGRSTRWLIIPFSAGTGDRRVR